MEYSTFRPPISHTINLSMKTNISAVDGFLFTKMNGTIQKSTQCGLALNFTQTMNPYTFFLYYIKDIYINLRVKKKNTKNVAKQQQKNREKDIKTTTLITSNTYRVEIFRR